MSHLGASSKLATGNNNKRLAPPSPSPSNASNASKTDGTPSAKRQKREGGVAAAAAAAAAARDRGVSPTPTPAALAAANVNYGNDMLTHLTYAVDFLKSKGAPKTLREILDHLSLQRRPESYQQQLAMLMRKHPRMQFTPAPRASKNKDGKDGKDGKENKDKDEPSWKQGMYEFRPKIPGVKSKTSLLAHLQAKTDASALGVKELKDGWPDCDGAIDELEAEHRILVVRTRKDNHAKFIWADDPRLAHRVDPEFKATWHRVEVPPADDIVRKLVAVGQKPASEDPRLKKLDAGAGAGGKKPKRRANRGGKPQQNVHMTHLLQDFSGLRK